MTNAHSFINDKYTLLLKSIPSKKLILSKYRIYNIQTSFTNILY